MAGMLVAASLVMVLCTALGAAHADMPDAGDDPIIGSHDAPLTIIEFGDYGDPRTAAFNEEILPHIITQYVEPGMAKVVFRDFASYGIHPNSVPAARAAECADDHNKFAEMRDYLFKNQDEWKSKSNSTAFETFARYAHNIGIDKNTFDMCMSDPRTIQDIRDDYMDGLKYGVRGSPTYFILNQTDYVQLCGIHPYDTFDMALSGDIVEPCDPGEYEMLEPSLNDDPMIGSPHAPIEIIEFVDFASHLSAAFHADILPHIITQYVETGRAKIIFRDSQIIYSHFNSGMAAQAAECADDQGKFEEMAGYLFRNQDEWRLKPEGTAHKVFAKYAANTGADPGMFKDCMSSWSHLREILGDHNFGVDHNIGGPALFIGNEHIGYERVILPRSPGSFMHEVDERLGS